MSLHKSIIAQFSGHFNWQCAQSFVHSLFTKDRGILHFKISKSRYYGKNHISAFWPRKILLRKRIFKNSLTEPEICSIVDMGELNLREIKNQNVRPVSEIRNRHKPKGIKWNLLWKGESRAASTAPWGYKNEKPPQCMACKWTPLEPRFWKKETERNIENE